MGLFDKAFDGLAGGLGAGALSFLGQRHANKRNIASAREQMRFQESMSSSAHQREVADLRAAGLNPILSAGGSGASAPGGAMATVENAIGKGISSAQEQRRLRKEINAFESQDKLNTTTGAKLDQDKATGKAQEELLQTQKEAADQEKGWREAQIKTDKEFYPWEKAMSIVGSGADLLLKGAGAGFLGGKALGPLFRRIPGQVTTGKKLRKVKPKIKSKQKLLEYKQKKLEYKGTWSPELY